MSHELVLSLDVSHADEQRLRDAWLSGPAADVVAVVFELLARPDAKDNFAVLDAVCAFDETMGWESVYCQGCGLEVLPLSGVRDNGWWHRNCAPAPRCGDQQHHVPLLLDLADDRFDDAVAVSFSPCAVCTPEDDQ